MLAEGDPDQPIVTGRVYNADNMPPYELPGNQTQSGLKSRSSLDGTADNFNEMGHTAFLMDAKIMAAVLYHFLTDATFREQVKTEHRTMAQLMDQYIAGLRDVYKQELSLAVDK